MLEREMNLGDTDFGEIAAARCEGRGQRTVELVVALDRQLSAAERVVSVVAVIVWLKAEVVVLGRSGFLAVHRPTELFRRATWLLVAVSAVAALPNLVSQSPWEQLVFGPTALVLAVLCLVVARSAAGPPSAVLARRAS
jgi:hypothetical protein